MRTAPHLQLKTRVKIAIAVWDAFAQGGTHSPFAYLLLQKLRDSAKPGAILTTANLYEAARGVPHSEPLLADFGRNEPGSDFFFECKGTVPRK